MLSYELRLMAAWMRATDPVTVAGLKEKLCIRLEQCADDAQALEGAPIPINLQAAEAQLHDTGNVVSLARVRHIRAKGGGR